MMYATLPYQPISDLKNHVGETIEIVAFGISYRGKLESVNEDQGMLKIVDGEDYAILELERVDSYTLLK